MSIGVIRYQNLRNGEVIYSSKHWKEKDINGKTFVDAVRQDPSINKTQNHFYMLKEALKKID